jgi:NAD(P)-dependent dehydrogenase (short-subunit alcohol dehydrogenase family)
MNTPVVLITGGLTGIGRATAIGFAQDGARLVVSGRRDEEGSQRRTIRELDVRLSLGRFSLCERMCPNDDRSRQWRNAFHRRSAGVKAGARSTAYDPGNFAKRGLAQSLARDLGPKGIHVAWINIDGGIDLPHRQRPDVKKEELLNPDTIVETSWHLAHQDRSAWTMELELRPFKEKF